MSIAQTRGGYPDVFRDTIDSTGRPHAFKFTSQYLILRSAAQVKMFFTEADFDAGVNYVQVEPPGVNHTTGEWQGPVEVDTVWLKATTTAAVELVAIMRRG